MTIYGSVHPRTNVNLLYVSRKKGGRRVVSIQGIAHIDSSYDKRVKKQTQKELFVVNNWYRSPSRNSGVCTLTTLLYVWCDQTRHMSTSLHSGRNTVVGFCDPPHYCNWPYCLTALPCRTWTNCFLTHQGRCAAKLHVEICQVRSVNVANNRPSINQVWFESRLQSVQEEQDSAHSAADSDYSSWNARGGVWCGWE